MDDPAAVVGALIWTAVIGAWAAHLAWGRSARARRAAGSCTRCGAGDERLGSPQPEMCRPCRATTRRNYRAGYMFFACLAGLFLVLTPIAVTSEYRRVGGTSAIQALALLLAMVGINAGVGLALRHLASRISA